ncbi:hypothetical protein KAR91_41155 [Candidatus Pacearchaeota archaeon]|nr:hypothetical protein [Candidatus Pacearchaeota archaeon]
MTAEEMMNKIRERIDRDIMGMGDDHTNNDYVYQDYGTLAGDTLLAPTNSEVYPLLKDFSMNNFDPPLDADIENAVNILFNAGVETFESCEGGIGHAYPEPTIRFHGDRHEGLRAFVIAMQNSLKVAYLRRIYQIIDGELIGPYWEIVFAK